MAFLRKNFALLALVVAIIVTAYIMLLPGNSTTYIYASETCNFPNTCRDKYASGYYGCPVDRQLGNRGCGFRKVCCAPDLPPSSTPIPPTDAQTTANPTKAENFCRSDINRNGDIVDDWQTLLNNATADCSSQTCDADFNGNNDIDINDVQIFISDAASDCSIGNPTVPPTPPTSTPLTSTPSPQSPFWVTWGPKTTLAERLTGRDLLNRITTSGQNVFSVARYDSDKNSWESVLLTPPTGTDFDIELGKGYAVQFKGEGSLENVDIDYVDNITETTTYNLTSGRNLITLPQGIIESYKSFYGKFTAQELCLLIDDKAGKNITDVIRHHINPNDVGYHYWELNRCSVNNNLFNIESETAYFVEVSEPVSFELSSLISNEISVDPTQAYANRGEYCQYKIHYQTDVSDPIITFKIPTREDTTEYPVCGGSRPCDPSPIDHQVLANNEIEYRLYNADGGQLLAGPATFTCFETSSSN